MAKNIQIKYINDTGEWETLDPKTNATIVQTVAGNSVEVALSEKALDDAVYKKTETYTQAETNSRISAVEEFNIGVSATEPSLGEQFWFEII